MWCNFYKYALVKQLRLNLSRMDSGQKRQAGLLLQRQAGGWMEFEKAFTVLEESTNWNLCKVMQYMRIKMGKRP